MIVCLAANPSVDRLFEVERLVKGDIHRPSGFVQVAGGKGLNVARAASFAGRRCVRGCAAARTQRPVAAGVARRRGCRRRVRVDPRGEPVLAVGRRPGDRRAHRVLRARRRRAGCRVGRADPRGHPALATRSWLTISGLAPAGRAGRWLPRPDPRGAPRGRPRRARLRGERLRLALTAEPEIVKVNVAEAGGLLGVPTARRDDSLVGGVARSGRWRVATGTRGSSRAAPRA